MGRKYPILKNTPEAPEGNKHLVMTDRFRWPVVEVYVDNSLASDSEDERKIRRAIKESKNEEQRQGQRVRKFEGKTELSSPLPAHLYPQSLNPGSYSNFQKEAKDRSYGCGRLGHYARNCKLTVSFPPGPQGYPGPLGFIF